jgi:hypothetical protein
MPYGIYKAIWTVVDIRIPIITLHPARHDGIRLGKASQGQVVPACVSLRLEP